MTQSLHRSPADVDQAREAIDYWNKSLQVEPNQPVIKQLVERFSGAPTRKIITLHDEPPGLGGSKYSSGGWSMTQAMTIMEETKTRSVYCCH